MVSHGGMTIATYYHIKSKNNKTVSSVKNEKKTII